MPVYALTYEGNLPEIKGGHLRSTSPESMNSSDGISIKRSVSGYTVIADIFDIERKFSRALRWIIDADGVQALDGLVLSHIAQGDTWVKSADAHPWHQNYPLSVSRKFRQAKFDIEKIIEMKNKHHAFETVNS